MSEEKMPGRREYDRVPRRIKLQRGFVSGKLWHQGISMGSISETHGTYLYVLNPSGLALGNEHDTHGADDEEIEGRRADDGARAELSCLEVASNDLNDGQKDLRSRGTQGHQGKVGHGVAPNSHLNDFRLILLL